MNRITPMTTHNLASHPSESLLKKPQPRLPHRYKNLSRSFPAILKKVQIHTVPRVELHLHRQEQVVGGGFVGFAERTYGAGCAGVVGKGDTVAVGYVVEARRGRM